MALTTAGGSLRGGGGGRGGGSGSGAPAAGAGGRARVIVSEARRDSIPVSVQITIIYSSKILTNFPIKTV